MGSPRPSVRTENYHIKNVVTPDTKRASEEIKRKKQKNYKRQVDREKLKEKQNARVIGSSLKRKSREDFNLKSSISPNIPDTAKRGILIGTIAVIVLAIGVAIGIFAFMAATSAKLSIGEDAKAKLVRVQENQPYYMLFVADVDNDSNNCPELIMLTRVDPVNKSFIIIQIPVDTYVAAASGGGTTLKKIYEEKGDVGIIESVATFSEIGITHYVRASADGISSLTDAFGGIEVDLKEYVDDPKVGDTYIPQGKSVINGKEVLTLLNATNFSGGQETISNNQRQVCVGFLKAALYNKSLNIPMMIDQLAGKIQSDMGAADIITFINIFATTSEDKIMNTQVPGYKTIRNNNMVFMIDASDWKNLRTQITYGTIPTSSSEYTIADINPSSFTILIQNGAGVTGAASMLGNQLTNLGFNVIGTENAESTIYQETLIIYSDDSMKKNAEVIKNSINNGRLVNGKNLYTMHSDILIIIGSDLKI